MKEVTYVLQKQMFQQKLNLADIAIASLSFILMDITINNSLCWKIWIVALF